jgi:hypothetical protein
MRCDQSPQRFGADQRRISGEHDDQLGAAQSSTCHLHGMTRSMLRLLKHRCSPGRLDHGNDLLGLVSYYHDRLFRAERRTCPKNLFNQGSPARAVQYFRKA